LSCLFLMTASRMRACACDTAARLCVRTVLCSSAFSLPRPFAPRAPPQPRPLCSLASLLLRAGATFARAHRRPWPPAFPTRSQPRLVGMAMEISRFPGGRLLRMPGSATTRGRLVAPSRLLSDGKHQRSELVLRHSIPSLRTPLSTLRLQPRHHTRMTRDRCGSLRLHRGGLAPPTFHWSSRSTRPQHHNRPRQSLTMRIAYGHAQFIWKLRPIQSKALLQIRRAFTLELQQHQKIARHNCGTHL
jgi:hypothetical protein